MKLIATVLLGVALSSPIDAAEVFAGVSRHDIDLGINNCCYKRGADIQFGVRTAPLARLLGAEVRGHALGSVNTGSGVDFGAVGASLRFTLPLAGLYVAPGLGLAAQSGSTAHYQVRPDKLYLGSRVLFEPELSLGWRVLPGIAVELAYTHLSHAQIAGPQNPGLDDLGVRAVVRF